MIYYILEGNYIIFKSDEHDTYQVLLKPPNPYIKYESDGEIMYISTNNKGTADIVYPGRCKLKGKEFLRFYCFRCAVGEGKIKDIYMYTDAHDNIILAFTSLTRKVYFFEFNTINTKFSFIYEYKMPEGRKMDFKYNFIRKCTITHYMRGNLCFIIYFKKGPFVYHRVKNTHKIHEEAKCFDMIFKYNYPAAAWYELKKRIYN